MTNEQFTKELGKALGRPAPWVVPGFALKIVLGEFAEEILAGQRALPTVLHESGFEFTHRTLGRRAGRRTALILGSAG